LAPHQHPPTRPPAFNVPAVDGIVREQGTAEALAGDVEPCVVLLGLEAAVREPDEPPALVDAATGPVADPDEITDVGTLNGSLPQLGAPKMKPANDPNVEQNVIPRGVALVAPDRFPLRPKEEKDGLDEMP
jgi:hypothetical protein